MTTLTACGASDPTMRSSIITGMTSQGVTDEVANCIVDAAIAQDLELSDFVDESIIVPLAEACQ